MALTVSVNSYVTSEEAATYLATRLGTAAWDAASSGDRTKALLMAARALETTCWDGAKADVTQAMEWPRLGLYDSAGLPLDTEDVPQCVKDAQCEQALWHLRMAADAGADRREVLQRQGVTYSRAGEVQEGYGARGDGGLCPAAVRLAGRYLLRSPRALRGLANGPAGGGSLERAFDVDARLR